MRAIPAFGMMLSDVDVNLYVDVDLSNINILVIFVLMFWKEDGR